ncbi:MAG: hypothetical protein RB296_05305 [Acidobacteriota bacterium]|jgi:Tfp pilus assembly protein PilP|nr:hypothetical protein [Acidobacteriota bacterium]
MHGKEIFVLFAILALWLMPLEANAQETEKPADPVQEATVADVTAADEGMETGAYIYKPMGRRDPFWDLLRGKNIKNSREAREGIEGLMIDELDLEGTFFYEDKYKALLKGPDGIPYVVEVGQKVYDGELISIDRYTVVFKKILTVALGGSKERIIEKRLNPDEEEGIK